MSKRGLPTGIKMRHDAHYVEELSKANRYVGKIISINQIEPNPEQPRTEIGDLSDLVSSIRQNGVLEPLLVKPNDAGTWMIIAGERRWRAANLAGLREVPCIELDIDDKTVAEIALIENLQRKDLTIWEEADGLAALAEKFGYTHEEIAKKISKSRTTVTESLTIAKLPRSIRERCLQSSIHSKSTLLEIARQFDEKAMLQFLNQIQKQSLSRDEVRRAARPPAEKVSDSANRGAVARSDRENNIFRYAANRDFNLQIEFKGQGNSEKFEKKDVLRALKETFERVKAGADL